MKKSTYALAIITALVFSTTTVYAQQGFDTDKVQIGAGLLYGSGAVGDQYSSASPHFGIMVDGYYRITNNIRAGVGVFYYFSKDEELPQFNGTYSISQFALNFNGHYILENYGELIPYVLAGINYITWNVETDIAEAGAYDDSFSEWGINVGGGASIGPAFIEAKYVIGNASQFVVNVGVRLGL